MQTFPTLAPTEQNAAYAAFLREQLQQQPVSVMRHQWQGRSLWVKRAGMPNPAWRYRALAALAQVLGVPALQPVPNPGGQQAIATEVQRLQQLAAAGLRVPQVLAHQAEGFVMQDLGQGHNTPSLGNAMEQAPHAPAALALWQQGLQALRQVHDQGQCLSQAFARNMVLCPDGVVGFIDFEDDPAAHLPPAQCQLRDALCFIHSTAWIMARYGVLPAAQTHWQAWQAGMHPDAQAALAQAQQRLRGLRWLPTTRRWGRDAQRLRQAWELLSCNNR